MVFKYLIKKFFAYEFDFTYEIFWSIYTVFWKYPVFSRLVPRPNVMEWNHSMVYILVCQNTFRFFSNITLDEIPWITPFSFLILSLDLLIVLPSYRFVYSMTINFHSLDGKLEHSANRSLVMPAPTFSRSLSLLML